MVDKVEAKRRARKRAEDGARKLYSMDDEAWQRFLPEARKIYEEAKKQGLVGTWGDFFPEDPKDTLMFLVDRIGQSLNFRVGPVFKGNRVSKEPGIWIGFQRKWMHSDGMGELLISPKMWRILSKELERKLRKFSWNDYRQRKSR